MKKILIAMLLMLAGCGDNPQAYPRTGPSMQSGQGYVRSIDWYHMTFVHETDDGYQKVFDICGTAMPVWLGEHVNVFFHHYDNGYHGCDIIEGAQRK